MDEPVYIGEVVEFAFRIARRSTGQAVTPGTYTLTIKLPNASTTTPSLTAADTGHLTATYTTTQAGTHYWRLVGTANGSGHGAGAIQGSFDVVANNVA